MATQVQIRTGHTTSGTDKLIVQTPYHPDFPKRARELGGNWNGVQRLWFFDVRDEVRVRDLVKECYGTDGTPSVVVTVRSEIKHVAAGEQQLFLYGREVARRWDRDSRVRLGEGCVVVAGEFGESGGSRNHPRLGDCTGVVLEIRDVPLAAAIADTCSETCPGPDATHDHAVIVRDTPALPARDPEADALDAARAAMQSLSPEGRARILAEFTAAIEAQ